MIASLLEGETLVQIAYLIASGLFVLALMWMSSPKTARRGVWAGEVGMVLAVVGTLLHHDVVSYDLILIARSGEPLNALASSARLLYWLSVSRCSMS